MLGLTKKDFMIQSSSFDIRRPWNLLRITAGAFLLPHAFGKVVGGALNPAVVGFFEKAGFQPPETWVMVAFFVELICGVALVLGLLTRYAALGACMTLFVAAGALHLVKGFGWYWNLGGYEYPIFWAIVCLAISMQAFQVKNKG
jgi:putative oxidoreductase